MPTRRAKLYPTPDEAETAFYEAFERADLAAMMTVWAETDAIVCVHPRGPRLVGFDAVRDSWIQIFAGGRRIRVRPTEVRRYDGNSVAVHTLVEAIGAPGERATQSVCATNVYELTDGGWRMVVHHATPLEEPATEKAEPAAPSSHTLH